MEGIIQALIQLCLLVLVVYVIFWVLSQLGIALPENVVKIIWVIVALLALLMIIRLLLPGGFKLGVFRAHGELQWQSQYALSQPLQPSEKRQSSSL